MENDRAAGAEDRESQRYTGALVKVDRILGLLEREGPATASAIAARLGIDRSTAYRLAQALWRMGWLRYDPRTKRYRLGIRLWELGARAIADLDVRQIARPYMREVVNQTGESCDLAVLDGSDIVYIEVIEGTREVRAATQLGERVPAHAVAMGKALLADLSHEERARILPPTLRRFTPLTAGSLAEFNARADAVRELGYAVNLGEHNPEAGGMAVPIRDGNGRTVAAIGINVPAARMTEDNIARLAPILLEAGAAISRELGHRSRTSR
jgi:IclR family KDG regulon transcriptional repressor